jgi:hypothetical protein
MPTCVTATSWHLSLYEMSTQTYVLAGNTIVTTQCHSALLKDARFCLVGPVKLAGYDSIALRPHDATWSVPWIRCSGGMGQLTANCSSRRRYGSLYPHVNVSEEWE